MPQWPLVHVAISVQVGTLDGQLPGAQVAPPPHDLDRLTGAGVVEVAELGDFDPADLVAVVGVVAGTVPERNVPPGQLPDLGAQAGRIRLHDGHVVSAAADRTAAVSVQGVGGDRGVLRIQAVQPRHEGGNLVALAGDLPLGQDHDVAVLAHNPCTTFPSTATTRHADDFPSGMGRDAHDSPKPRTRSTCCGAPSTATNNARNRPASFSGKASEGPHRSTAQTQQKVVVDSQIDAEHLMFIGLAAWWCDLPQLATTSAGAEPDTPSEQAKRRACVVKAAQRPTGMATGTEPPKR